MLIAIDYDDTFDARPEYWRAAIELGIGFGVRYVCVTGRSDEGAMGREVREAIDGLIPIVFANQAYKSQAAKAAVYLPTRANARDGRR